MAAMPRPPRPARPASAFLAALLAACSGGGSEPALWILEGSEAVRFEPGADLPQRRVLLAGAEAADPEAWSTVLGLAESPDPGRLRALAESSAIEPDGTLVLRSEHGAWVRAVAVEPGSAVRLEVVVETRGFDPGGTGEARVGLVELADLPPDPGQAAGLLLDTHWAPLVTTDRAGTPRTLLIQTGPATRAVGLLLGVHHPEPRAGAEARFRTLRLIEPGAADYLAQELGHAGPVESPRRPPLGRFTLGLTERPGLALLPGSRCELETPFPAGASRVELWGGLVPLADDLGPGRAELVLEAVPGDGPRLELARRSLAVEEGLASRWVPLGFETPPELRGRRARLTLRSEGRFERYAPVLAGARLVPERPRRAGPSVVVVSLDTLRADRVGCYGHDRDTTPHLDAFAERAVLFEDTWATAPYTLPSHVSLFSGQFASVHAVHEPGDPLDGARSPFLAEVLHARGYATAAFTGGGYVLPEFGFGRGFDRYGAIDPAVDADSARSRRLAATIPGYDRSLAASHSLDAVGRWLEEHRDESFLLFFHTYAAHEFDPEPRHLEALGLEPRTLLEDPLSMRLLGPPEGWPDELPDDAFERLFELYDGGVRQADEALGGLFAHLDRLDLWDDTIVVVGSDHGKEIGDHGGVGHGHTLYEEMLRVPLLFHVPGRPPERRPDPAMTVDVVPTLLALLGLPPLPGAQGVDLFAPLPRRPLFAEVDHMAVKSALRRGPAKTIHSPLDADCFFPNRVPGERYDLARDPAERSPLELAPEPLREVAAYRDALRALGASLAGEGGTQSALSREARAYLHALGYTEVGGD